MIFLSFLAAGLMLTSDEAGDLSRHIYPLSRSASSPSVELDVSDFPQSKKWGETAQALVKSWFPTVWSLLATDRAQPPKGIRLVIKKEISAPAWASGDTITISGKWITEHPDDLGMVIHELTHVVQQYPSNKVDTGWLVEGIADYVRWWRYEPEAPRPRIDREKSKHTDAYRTTAYFLAWASRRYHMGLVPALDGALRKGDDPHPIFVKLTGKPVQELWKEFLEALPRS